MLYLEDYLETLDSLPADMLHTFTTMREMDLNAQSLLEKIESSAKAIFQANKRLSQEQREKEFKKIKEDYDKCLELSDEKIKLATQALGLYEKHIKKLDIDLKSFSSELEIDAPGVASRLEKSAFSLEDLENFDSSPSAGNRKTDPSKTLEKKMPRNRPPHPHINSIAAMPDLMPSPGGNSLMKSGRKSGHRLSGPKVVLQPSTSQSSVFTDFEAPTFAFEQASLDPNEPRYCICNQVSFGEMVGCDNPNCNIEWFHYGCVGITEPPKGKWYCHDCQESQRRSKPPLS